ncbi:lactate utilization protein C [Corynebacterium kroppenstedtii]|uniref:LutC/YkgG family protein n=1 Tax=Corynebacterium sp. PCR 32 TaxID=3351342 RepID=UPI0030A9990C
MESQSASAKDEILGRIRNANRLAGVSPQPYPIPRDYGMGRTRNTQELVELLEDRLLDYKADVHIVEESDLPSTVAEISEHRGFSLIGVAEGLDESIYSSVSAVIEKDDRSTDPHALGRFDAIITESHVSSAQTGTIYLDSSATNGRRALTLVPDCHVCIVREESIVYGVPEAVERLDPEMPITLISGPSATSDIELNRVEGVHGPRTLIVVIVKA